MSNVDHPIHYGGQDNPHEAIKCIEAHGLGFCLGNALKYIVRADHKRCPIEDLEKARWYLDREIARRRALAVASPGGWTASGLPVPVTPRDPSNGHFGSTD
jgi:hypothetical protein